MKAKRHAVRWIGYGMLWFLLTTAFFGCGQTSGEALLFSAEGEAVTEADSGSTEADAMAADGAAAALSADTASDTASAASSVGAVHAAGNSAENTIVVYVCGAVKNAGVYDLTEEARVCDAIEAAGGFTKKADRTALNLARVLTDGEMVLVPSEGESSQGTGAASDSQTGSASSTGGTGQTSGVSSGGKVNINRADAAELATITGIGPTRAAKIIEDRNANGPFSSIQEITRVSGIGETLYQNMKDEITVE